MAALGFDFSSISCQCIMGWQTLSWMLDGRDKVSVHVIEAGKQALLFTGRHFWNRKCRKKTWWQQEFAVFKCEATANSVTGHVCVNSNGEEVRVMFRDVKNYDIMSASEPESCLQIYGERRMAITIAASAAVSIEDANRDII